MSIVIPIENGFAVSVYPLHTEANGWRCRNADCPCREDRRPVITLDKNAMVKCEMTGCDRASVNTCTHCGKAVCIVHRYPAIADDGHQAYQCVECFFAS